MKIDLILAYVQRYEFGHERDFVLQAHRTLWKRSFSPLYAFKRIMRGLFTLSAGAFLLSAFMNSFYCYKRMRKNYPVDMTKRKNLNKLVEPQVRSFGENAMEYVSTYS
ncbi:hypothetical protein [Niastella populi]|uniref:Uncharacterized protein n=1 Tax=Niastella populi TaxID=550983 RepID=A0A1V9FGU8_9BACT|nr:hypothetical protein [Niastella populi]OQP57588.1 hypothetical protein A4R26_23980 [Niastella populi]